MKHLNHILILLLVTVFTLPLSAKKWRVNNTLLAPQEVDFNQLTEAAMVANSGDTIYVEGSPIPYDDDVEIDRQLTIIGPGYLRESNPNICNHLNASITSGPSIILKSGSDGTYITGLNLVSSNTLAGISFDPDTDPINNITITRNRINSIRFVHDVALSNIYIDRNFFCGSIFFTSFFNINNLHITNNLILGNIVDAVSNPSVSNSSLRNNTFSADSHVWMEGSEISYNYVGRIESEPNNISIHHNILSITNNEDNQIIKDLAPSNICDPYEDETWDCDDDNWEFLPADQTSTHGAYNGLGAYPIPHANLPAWPIIEACSVQPCGDTTIQVSFQVRSNN